MKEDILEFVARYFKPHALDRNRAWRHISAGRRSGWRPAYTLATALAALAIGLFLFIPGKTGMTVIPASASAQTVVLPDGTLCTLAPGATISFHGKHFAHNDRIVQMGGKVYFEVERNERLPFLIQASDAVVTVLGTRFQVIQDADSTAVDVVSGRVSFASANNPDEGIVLERGMHAALFSGAARARLTAPASLNPAAWATHVFTYEQAPLPDVLLDVSECFGCTLECDATDRRLSGTLRAESAREAVQLIEETLDIKITIL